jgi:23S rRNA pseudouridine1911/1915/1917 synthase
MTDTFRFIADRGDVRLRLDQVLVRRVTGVARMSRSLAQQWIESGAVTVDRRIARRPSARVREGVPIEVTIPSSTPRRSRPEPEAGDLQILFEDDALLAINKPPGIVVHPSYKQAGGTLLNAVLWRLRDRAGARPGILTRLDRDTSGVVIVALTPDVHATMQRDAAAGRIRKEYLAVVLGVPHPPSGRIREPLARDSNDRRRVVVMPGGAESETRYEVLTHRKRGPSPGASSLSLVRCELMTGRTHQIRVHLAFKGWPILGDRVYGTADAAIARQALHAWRMAFPHPVTREPMEIQAPVPDDLKRLGLEHGSEQGSEQGSEPEP